MADKSVGELIAAQSVTPTDLFVLEQNGTAKKLTGQILENWLVSFADGHGGIQSIVKKSTSGLVDTYRITLADTTTFDFMVTNGKGINSVSKVSTSGLVDTYRITFNDGTSSTFTVTNGEKGDKGDNQYVWIKYASQKPTASSHSFGDVADNWIGIYSGASATAPTDWQQYTWFQWKGEKGDTGDPATLISAEIRYQVGDSGTIIPSGSWSTSVPPVTPGRYLWTRQVLQFNSGAPITSYSVSRFGIDGTGAVSTVAGVAPDKNGNVALDASSVKALSITGGFMEGAINMNGQKLRGLNAPTEEDEPATKGYADNLKPDLTGYATENFVTNTIAEKTVNNFTTTEEGFVADARALKVLNDSKLSMELMWENDSPSSEFAGRKIPMTLNEGEIVEIVFSDSPNARGAVGSVIIANITTCGAAGGSIKYNSIREMLIDTDGITFKDGLNQTQSGATVQATKTANNILRPLKIYRIKEVS